MINRKRIREYISCPESGDDHYGRWGILTKEQRLTIYDLLKILDSADCVIENLYQENNQLKNKIDKAIEVIHTQMKNNPSYKENLKIIEKNLIKGSCKVCDLKNGDVDGRE